MLQELHFLIRCTVCGTEFIYLADSIAGNVTVRVPDDQMSLTTFAGCSCEKLLSSGHISTLGNLIQSTSCQFERSQLQSRGYNYRLDSSEFHIQLIGDARGNCHTSNMPEFASRAPAWRNQVIHGDCLTVLREMPSDFVDLVVTSPPYADSRKRTYGGIHPDKYVEWFTPITQELLRVLKPQGTFILNIKEKVVRGERHTYAIDAILEMRKQGWLWTEEFIWHKKSCHPGKWPNRFRDAWERCLQFNKQKQFAMYQESVMVPMGDWAKARLKNLSETDRRRDNSRVKSGFGKNVSNWVNRTMAYPSNVLHMASETSNKNHSAVYPLSLPTWFVRLFSKEGDLVLDPFLGSGTTAVAAKLLGRHYLGIETVRAYVKLAEKALQNSHSS